jgi:hypothetical protein
MKIIFSVYLLLCATFLFGQEAIIKTKDNNVKKDFIKRFQFSQTIIQKFFNTDKLDTITKYRPDLSRFKKSLISHKVHSDSIKGIPDEYDFSYDFFRGGKYIDNFILRVTIDETSQDKMKEWNLNGLTGIAIILKGESLITRDSVERISQHYFPNKPTVIQLDSNYEPFNIQKTVRYYWTIRRSEDLKKAESSFIRVDLKTGEIEEMIQKY